MAHTLVAVSVNSLVPPTQPGSLSCNGRGIIAMTTQVTLLGR